MSTLASARALQGEVYLDHNRNLRRDTGESGIAGVKLSNGRELVLTDSRGRYRIQLHAGDSLHLIKPPRFAMPVDAQQIPLSTQHEVPASSTRLRFGGRPESRASGRFALWPMAADVDPAAPLQVLLFADSQPKSPADVDYFARDVVEPLRGRQLGSVGITLGDVVSDDLALLPAMKSIVGRLGVPWLHIAGNHDIDFDAANDAGSLDTFRAHFGADTFAWEEPQLSFIGLDDVIYQPGTQHGYIGGLREDQFAFLQAYLPTLPRDRLLVLGVHIPLFDAAPGRETFRHTDRERLFALLQPFPRLLILSGHSHAQQHVFHSAEAGWQGPRPLHEYNVGAACGGYWSGVFDADGIPDSMMADGTPNGYATLRVEASGDYSLAWFPAREEQQRLRLHAPKVLRQGAWPGAGIYANVFMGMDDSRVEMRIDGGEWRHMQRVMRADPWVLAENLRDDAAPVRRGFDRIPEAEASQHLWRLPLPTDLAVGEHRVDVRAFDRWLGPSTVSHHYRLEASP